MIVVGLAVSLLALISGILPFEFGGQ